jgi:hypothetical protein
MNKKMKNSHRLHVFLFMLKGHLLGVGAKYMGDHD